jgi:small GTP-binding protein
VRLIQAKICLLGDFAVGKTSLVRRFVEGRFDDRYLSTIGVKISRKLIEREAQTLKVILWDLAGGEDFKSYEPSYLRGSLGALVVCDLTRLETLDRATRYRDQFLEINPGACLLLAANKADLKAEREFELADLQAAGETFGRPCLLTSAKTGEQVEDAFLALAEMIEEQM